MLYRWVGSVPKFQNLQCPSYETRSYHQRQGAPETRSDPRKLQPPLLLLGQPGASRPPLPLLSQSSLRRGIHLGNRLPRRLLECTAGICMRRLTVRHGRLAGGGVAWFVGGSQAYPPSNRQRGTLHPPKIHFVRAAMLSALLHQSNFSCAVTKQAHSHRCRHSGGPAAVPSSGARRPACGAVPCRRRPA